MKVSQRRWSGKPLFVRSTRRRWVAASMAEDIEDVAVRRAPVVLGLQEERACTDHAQRKLADELARRVGSNEGPRDELGDRDERAAGERPFVLSKVERTVSRERIL